MSEAIKEGWTAIGNVVFCGETPIARCADSAIAEEVERLEHEDAARKNDRALFFPPFLPEREDYEITIEDRRKFARRALAVNSGEQECSDGDIPDYVTDLLANTLHLCAAAGVDFDEQLRGARAHYAGELAVELAEAKAREMGPGVAVVGAELADAMSMRGLPNTVVIGDVLPKVPWTVVAMWSDVEPIVDWYDAESSEEAIRLFIEDHDTHPHDLYIVAVLPGKHESDWSGQAADVVSAEQYEGIQEAAEAAGDDTPEPEVFRPYIARVDGAREVFELVPTLHQAQEIVGGYVERVIPRKNPHLILLVNEEGLLKGLPINVHASELYGDPIVGDVCVLSQDTAGDWR